MPKQKLSAARRKRVFQRDNWRCRCCGNRQMLDPHHVIYQSAGGGHGLENLLTLCRNCHDAEHAGRLRIEVVRILNNPATDADLEVKFWRE
jgi:5-methylcytosine-specific restriction endonuclease McrA